MANIVTVANVQGYLDEQNTAWLNAEDVSRGFGFTYKKDGVEYIRWERINSYLESFGYFATRGENSPRVGKGDYLPENMVYRLGFKANNETAARFQSILADDVLPSIRKHGAYMTQDVIERTLQDPDYLIQLATTLKEEKQKRIEAESVAAKRGLIIAEQQKELTEAAPKVEYHDKVLSSEGYLTVNMIAASIGISDRKLNKLLCEWGVQYKESGSYQLYAPYRGKGYAKQIPYPYRDSLNQIRTKQHLYWTEAGKKFIIELYEKKSA